VTLYLGAIRLIDQPSSASEIIPNLTKLLMRTLIVFDFFFFF
jgi:hypothetical protein